MIFCMVKFVDLRFPSSSGSMFFWEGTISGMLQRGNSVFYSEFCCVTWKNLYWWIHSFMNQSKPAPSISPWGWSDTWGSMVNHPVCRGYTQFNEGHVGICHCYGSYISHHLAVIRHHSSLGWNLYWTVELTTQTRKNYAWLFCNPCVHFVATSIWLYDYVQPIPKKNHEWGSSSQEWKINHQSHDITHFRWRKSSRKWATAATPLQCFRLSPMNTSNQPSQSHVDRVCIHLGVSENVVYP